jgi:hypothetical protein
VLFFIATVRKFDVVQRKNLTDFGNFFGDFLKTNFHENA